MPLELESCLGRKRAKKVDSMLTQHAAGKFPRDLGEVLEGRRATRVLILRHGPVVIALDKPAPIGLARGPTHTFDRLWTVVDEIAQTEKPVDARFDSEDGL